MRSRCEFNYFAAYLCLPGNLGDETQEKHIFFLSNKVHGTRIGQVRNARQRRSVADRPDA